MKAEVEHEVTEVEGENNKDAFACERCCHFDVCFLRKNISDFMEQHFQKDKPFEVSELAKICRYYY